MEDWNIQIRNEACSQCHAPFVEKQAYHTVLRAVSNGYERREICPSCWTSAGEESIRKQPGTISYWQGVYVPPAPAPVDPLPKEDAESIFRRMLERNNSGEVEAKYILAVMLERKRILRHRETQNSNEKLLVYEHVKTGESFIIADPQLKLGQLEEVQRRVAAMLKPSQEPSLSPSNLNGN